MPNFLVPVHESNDCHNPEGPGGGRFCSTGGAITLPEATDRYFQMDATTQMIPVSQLDVTHTKPADVLHAEIGRAERHMRQAYDGEATRRKPISVRKTPDGRYAVLDGNATTTIAKKHGWTRLPAHVE